MLKSFTTRRRYPVKNIFTYSTRKNINYEVPNPELPTCIQIHKWVPDYANVLMAEENPFAIKKSLQCNIE